MLGGMLSQFGGFGGGGGKGSADINATIGGSFIQGQYTMFQQILKVTIRKVTLTVNWQVMGSDRDMQGRRSSSPTPRRWTRCSTAWARRSSAAEWHRQRPGQRQRQRQADARPPAPTPGKP